MGQNFSCVDKLKKEDFNFVETKNTNILEFFCRITTIFFYRCNPCKNMFPWVLVHYTDLSTTCPIHLSHIPFQLQYNYSYFYTSLFLLHSLLLIPIFLNKETIENTHSDFLRHTNLYPHNPYSREPPLTTKYYTHTISHSQLLTPFNTHTYTTKYTIFSDSLLFCLRYYKIGVHLHFLSPSKNDPKQFLNHLFNIILTQ